MSEDSLAWVDALAAERNMNRSEAMRLMLAFAQQKMPRGWNPEIGAPGLTRSP